MTQKFKIIGLKKHVYDSIIMLRGWNGCTSCSDVVEKLLDIFDKVEKQNNRLII